MSTPKKPRREYPEFHPEDRVALRAWLQENHQSSTGVWIIYDKKESGKQRLIYSDAVDEALCFGWIDSVINPVDAQRYKQLFTPRKPNSEWSAVNKKKLERLIAEGQMQAAGLAVIQVAKKNGSWSKIDEVEALTVPEELANRLEASPNAKKNFEAFSRSVKKMYLHWLNSAKRPETRAARLTEVMLCVEENLKARQLRKK
jgi:uncharacterized protein YdeI (YjbR/CyaY-like superfamily)